MKEPNGKSDDMEFLQYDTNWGEPVYVLNDSKPVGDGFYSNPQNRYMGFMYKSAHTGRRCGTCTLAGCCFSCAESCLFSGGYYKA